jgi:hypothetical protein
MPQLLTYKIRLFTGDTGYLIELKTSSNAVWLQSALQKRTLQFCLIFQAQSVAKNYISPCHKNVFS